MGTRMLAKKLIVSRATPLATPVTMAEVSGMRWGRAALRKAWGAGRIRGRRQLVGCQRCRLYGLGGGRQRREGREGARGKGKEREKLTRQRR